MQADAQSLFCRERSSIYLCHLYHLCHLYRLHHMYP